MSLVSFPECFKQLTGHPPFLWQERLYQEICVGKIPPLCDIPTGLGKTSILAIWLLALAEQASQPDAKLALPRRLVYVVNRRVVVDQATDDARQLLTALMNSQGTVLAGVADSLRSLAAISSSEEERVSSGSIAETELPLFEPTPIPNKQAPFALSTLRGQYADNREWSADPCRPAIIVGTVDMIGSRLLFSAYGARFRTKPLYAAFLGQDALIVHDEAHLEPAFQRLLEDIEKEQNLSRQPSQLSSCDSKPIQVMQLSATTRERKSPLTLSEEETEDDSKPGVTTVPSQPFRLRKKEKAEDEVAKRLNARKRLQFHPLPDAKQLPEKLVERAMRHEGTNVAVLIFARTVENVEKVVDRLPRFSK